MSNRNIWSLRNNRIIKSIKSCKTENIIPTFAKVTLSLKHSNYKLKLHTARLVMETGMKKKYLEKKKLKKR